MKREQVIQALTGLILAGLVSWATWTTATVNRQETAIAVADKDQQEIKRRLIRIEDKLDRIIERNHHGRN